MWGRKAKREKMERRKKSSRVTFGEKYIECFEEEAHRSCGIPDALQYTARKGCQTDGSEKCLTALRCKVYFVQVFVMFELKYQSIDALFYPLLNQSF